MYGHVSMHTSIYYIYSSTLYQSLFVMHSIIVSIYISFLLHSSILFNFLYSSLCAYSHYHAPTETPINIISQLLKACAVTLLDTQERFSVCCTLIHFEYNSFHHVYVCFCLSATIAFLFFVLFTTMIRC